MDISINDIYAVSRRRAISTQKVAKLAHSITEIGLLNPITVQQNGANFRLVAGLHRLEAFKLLQRDTIPAYVVSFDEAERAELAEIDENLQRNELTVLEQAEHLYRRDEILEILGLRAKRGDNRYSRPDTVSGHKTTEDIAKEIGISGRSARRRSEIARNIAPEIRDTIADKPIANQTTQLLELARLPVEEQARVFEVVASDELLNKRLEDGKLKISDAKRELKKLDRAKEIEGDAPPAPVLAGLHPNTISVRDIYALDLPGESIDMIFTDPPYHDEYVHLFDRLGQVGAHVLKPGGYLMAYCGKMFLPEVMAALSNHLEYVWTYCVFQPDGNQKINKHHLFEAWRPIVCFKKPGQTSRRDWQPDAIRGTRDKRYHEWQQQIEPPIKYIAAYTEPGALVLDPFVGGGTTPAACKELNRHYVAFDVDPEAVSISIRRLSE